MTQKPVLRHLATVYARIILTAAAIGQASFLIQVLAAESALHPDDLLLKDVVVIRSVTRPGRSAVHIDPVEARIVSGQWHPPQVGEVLASSNGSEQRWEATTANEQGVLKGEVARGGYVYWPVRSEHLQIMLLEAAGHTCVYVNGEIRGGDSYGFGYLRLPVLLHAGTNDLLFQSGRGELRAKLISAPEPLSIHAADSTLPDIISGESEPVWGAAVLVNATTNFMRASLRVLEKRTPPQQVNIPPLGIHKAPFLLRPPRSKLTNSCAFTLEATDLSDRKVPPVHAPISVRVRRPDQTYVRTFRSEIDGSVQYYAVNPAPVAAAPGATSALFLSLHGAGVEARGQAEAYSPKKSGPIVCPTNRRPYGFDWEEWGRWDAMEVLRSATNRYHSDPQRIYLTGHSMGGHGTWQLGALFPDQFAAIGPSAGWISFTSYASPNRSPATNAIQRILQRAAAASDTLLMATNYLQEGVYILHGDADDNVPIAQAREMRQVLSGFHHDFEFHEQPGAGHWWDASDEPGADCVDWAPMFDFFAHHIIPNDESLRRVRFVTVNPAVSARSHWATILSQQRQLEPSAVDLRCDPGKRRLVGTTTNVSQLWVEFPTLDSGAGLTIELDRQKLENVTLPDPKNGRASTGDARSRIPGLCLSCEGGAWRVGLYPTAEQKRPERSGPFREAFRNRVVLVFGTKGTPEENAWALAKARFDAETFYYRGNASLEVTSDVDAIAEELTPSHERPSQHPARNVVLYGHAESNAAWSYLLGNSPVQVHRGAVQAGENHWKGEDLACLFLQPHPRDPNALVGVVAGSGLPGLRVTERMPYFLSGAGFPDCLIVSANLPVKGFDAVRAAGFFGRDWQVSTGEFARNETH